MNEGKKFENAFKKSCEGVPNLYFQRIKDSASSFGKDSAYARFTLNNPYDCFIYSFPHFFPLELKSTSGTSISIQKNKEEKSKMIKLHQIAGLTNSSENYGVIAGFIFNFRSKEMEKDSITYFMSIEDFNIFLNNEDKKSINMSDVIKYGGIELTQKKKRINYTYDIIKLIGEIILKWQDKHLLKK